MQIKSIIIFIYILLKWLFFFSLKTSFILCIIQFTCIKNFQLFEYDHTWWRLFNKCFLRTKLDTFLLQSIYLLTFMNTCELYKSFQLKFNQNTQSFSVFIKHLHFVFVSLLHHMLYRIWIAKVIIGELCKLAFKTSLMRFYCFLWIRYDCFSLSRSIATSCGLVLT